MRTSRFETNDIVNINKSSCDGCGTCVEVCPQNVFELRTISQELYKSLSLPGKLKVRIKGNTKSFEVHPEACVSCGRCEELCHERAIKVTKLHKRA